MKDHSVCGFAYGNTVSDRSYAAKTATPSTISGHGGRNLRRDYSGFVGRGFAAADDDPGRRTCRHFDRHALPVLPEQAVTSVCRVATAFEAHRRSSREGGHLVIPHIACHDGVGCDRGV